MGSLLTLSESVAAHARVQPGRLAVRDSRRALSYAELDRRAGQLAAGLRGLGLAQGDRVALLAYNCIEWIEIYVALARAGLVAVPINFRLRPPEIAFILLHSEARAIIVQDRLRDGIEPIREAFAIEPHCFITFGSAAADWTAYEALIADAAPSAPAADVAPGDLFALMYTSGTTGRPKGAMRSHEGNALIALATALEFSLGRSDVGLLVMPLCHANSLYFAVTFLTLGATIVVDDRSSFDPEALLATLSRERITFTSLVPTHYIMMLSLPAEVRARFDLASVGKLLVSSAPARKETKLAVLELFPTAKLFELYGSTEAGWVTVLRPDEQIDRIGSVGREWSGSGAIKLLDADGAEVADGEVGELHSRTAYVFDGYWKNPEKTAEAFRGAWCSVGDMAYRDGDGYIHLVDRKSNMIISGGENIYPSEVEAVLAAHAAVQDVAVVGLPDPVWGESVCAVVVTRPGHRTDATELSSWCRDRVAGYKRPRSFRIVTEADLPRTATGKIQHRALRDRLVAEAASPASSTPSPSVA